MKLIRNISLSARAATEFQAARRAFKAELGEAFALVWVSRHVEADGAPVPGFSPGYMCGPVYSEGLAAPWTLAELADGSRFYFMPRFDWDPGAHYIVDKPGELFSILRQE